MPAPFQPAADATVVKPTVPSRLQLAANAQPCRRPRACAAPAVRITIHESRPFVPFRPSLVRGTPPATPPCVCRRACASPAAVSATGKQCRHACAIPACRRRHRRKTDRSFAPPARRQRATVPTPACLRGSRSSNHDSRITNHGRSGRSGPPLCGGLPPQRPPVYAGVRAPPQLPCQQPGSNAAMPARFQPVADATVVKPTVPSRLQLAANAQPCRRPRACAAPAVRITNHESRITAVRAVPALPCAGGRPPQRPPVAIPSCRLYWMVRGQRSRGDATARAQIQSVRQRQQRYTTVAPGRKGRATWGDSLSRWIP